MLCKQHLQLRKKYILHGYYSGYSSKQSSIEFSIALIFFTICIVISVTIKAIVYIVNLLALDKNLCFFLLISIVILPKRHLLKGNNLDTSGITRK